MYKDYSSAQETQLVKLEREQFFGEMELIEKNRAPLARLR